VIRLSDGQTNTNASGLATVRAAQTAVAAADSLTALVDTDGFGMKTDNLHFNAVGQQQIGDATAFQLLNMYPFLYPPVMNLQSGGDIDIRIYDAFDGFLYTLEKSPDLSPGSWEEVETISASSAFITFGHTMGAGDVREFFRVERKLAP